MFTASRLQPSAVPIVKACPKPLRFDQFATSRSNGLLLTLAAVEADWATAGRAQVEDFRRRHRIGLGDACSSPTSSARPNSNRRLVTRRRLRSSNDIIPRCGKYLSSLPKAKRSTRQATLSSSSSRSHPMRLNTLSKFKPNFVHWRAKPERTVFDRIGIHVGEVFIDDAPSGTRSRDLFGLQVDTCARIMSLGGAHQILGVTVCF